MIASKGFPSIIQQVYLDMDYSKHKARLSEISGQNRKKKTLEALQSYKHSQGKGSKPNFLTQERVLEIDRENEVLLNKLVSISRLKKSALISVKSEPDLPKTLNTGFRKRQLEKIASENEALAKRLIAQKSKMNRKKLDKEYEYHQKLVSQVKQFNPGRTGMFSPLAKTKSQFRISTLNTKTNFFRPDTQSAQGHYPINKEEVKTEGVDEKPQTAEPDLRQQLLAESKSDGELRVATQTGMKSSENKESEPIKIETKTDLKLHEPEQNQGTHNNVNTQNDLNQVAGSQVLQKKEEPQQHSQVEKQGTLKQNSKDLASVLASKEKKQNIEKQSTLNNKEQLARAPTVQDQKQTSNLKPNRKSEPEQPVIQKQGTMTNKIEDVIEQPYIAVQNSNELTQNQQ